MIKSTEIIAITLITITFYPYVAQSTFHVYFNVVHDRKISDWFLLVSPGSGYEQPKSKKNSRRREEELKQHKTTKIYF